MLTITSKKCPECGRQDTYQVSEESVRKYEAGAHIQDAFPELNADQREQFQTGYCGPCFDRLFAPTDDEEEVND
jgi:hypothetical protein